MRLLAVTLLLLFAAPAMAQQGQGMSKALVVSSCGGGALPNGALTNLTMNPQGQLCLNGISSGACSQATAYLTRAPGETTHAADLTALICGLVTDGYWNSLDTLYVLAQQTQADAQLNLISASYNASVLSILVDGLPKTGAFTTFRGMTNFSWDTGFNPTTAPSPHYTQNSASFGFWVSTIFSEPLPQMGNDVSSGIYDYYTGSAFYARVNNASISSVPAPTTTGLYVGDRSNSAGVDPYYNGVDKGNQAGASGAPFSHTFYVGNAPSGAASAQTLSEAHIGASLGAAGELALYNRLRTYMTAVGAP